MLNEGSGSTNMRLSSASVTGYFIHGLLWWLGVDAKHDFGNNLVQVYMNDK